MSHSSEISAAPIVVPSPIARLLANRSLRDSTLLLVLAVIWIFFYFATNGTFLTQRNLILLALADGHRCSGRDQRGDADRHAQLRPVGRLGSGADRRRRGGADGEAQRRSGYAVVVSLAVGMLMGAWQGWWVTKMKVSSFIVTLAGMLYFRGISMIATNGATVAPLPQSLKQIATGFLPPIPSDSADRHRAGAVRRVPHVRTEARRRSWHRVELQERS